MLGFLRGHYERIEERLAHATDAARIAQPFAWGLEHLPDIDPSGDSACVLEKYASEQTRNSVRFFTHRPVHNFGRHHDVVTFNSEVETDIEENRTVHVRLFETRSRRRAVVLLPHWNAEGRSYDLLARALRVGGIAVARISLPCHDARRPSHVPTADGMVSANLGLTIASHRQAVLDVRGAIDWLEQRGYERIGLVGSSLGSCVAWLVAVHDERVRTLGCIHIAGSMGDVVWTSGATGHIKEAVAAEGLTREGLNACLLPISPLSYVPRLADRPVRPLLIRGRYDRVFVPEVATELLEALDRRDVTYRTHQFDCGHYNMKTFPFGVAVAVMLLQHLRQRL
ncbi:MAG: alpha/beta fold hydrolase [Planctomycetota bacterium]